MRTATFDNELLYWQKGYSAIVGIDEVGRGSWAGPVVCAGVVFPKRCTINYQVADSKLLTAGQRVKLDQEIRQTAQTFAVTEITVPVIDKAGIGQATQMAFRKVLQKLQGSYDFIFMDAFYICRVKKAIQLPIVKGDQISASIAAASIIAKVHRDALMTKLHDQYPNYNFAKHKGYGTKEHQKAIQTHGLSKIHRTSFCLEKYSSDQ